MFSEPSGLESLVKEKEEEEKEKLLKAEKKKKAELKKSDPSEAQALAQFEKVNYVYSCTEKALLKLVRENTA